MSVGKSAYYRYLVGVWLHNVIWLSAFIAAFVYHEKLGWIVYILPWVLIFLMPDRKNLFKGYDMYVCDVAEERRLATKSEIDQEGDRLNKKGTDVGT